MNRVTLAADALNQQIGLQTKDGYLYILIDATVALGPIQLTVSGVSGSINE